MDDRTLEALLLDGVTDLNGELPESRAVALDRDAARLELAWGGLVVVDDFDVDRLDDAQARLP